MDLRGFVGWALVLAVGCGDDVPSTASETGTETTFGETTFGTQTTEPTTTTNPSTSVGTSVGPGTETTSDPDSSTTSEGTSTTGEPVDPFGPAVELPVDVAFDPLALAMADFDGDGARDLLLTGTAASIVAGAVLPGDGAGGFGAAIDAGVTACSAFPIVGSIDEDGAADLFFGTCGVDAIFYTANGDGTFTAVDVLDDWAFTPVRSSRFVDHDDDGDDDLVLLTVDGMGQVQLHLALHGDTFPWPVTTSDVSVRARPGFDPNGIAIGSIDADGIPDVLMLDTDATLAYARGLAPVGHEAAVVLPLDVAPSSGVPFDIEPDGRDELVIGSKNEMALQVLRNMGGDGFFADPPLDLGGLAPLEIAIGRFDDDFAHDLAVLDISAPEFLVLHGEGDGGFVPVVTRDLPSNAVRLLSGDLDGTQHLDLVAATFAAGSITVLLAD